MKVLTQGAGTDECPYCHKVVELDDDDVCRWNSVYYYHCPCGETPHIRHGKFDNWLCPYVIKGKLAIRR